MKASITALHESGGSTCSFAGRLVCRLALIGLLVAPLPALADDPPSLLEDPFFLSLGSFVLNSDPHIRLEGQLGSGTEVDWGREVDSGDSTRVRFEGHWRFGDRHKVRWMWFNSTRSNTKVFEEDIEWGDNVYPVGATVKGEFNFDIYQVAYEYAFMRRDTFELAGSFGFHYIKFDTSLSAEASGSGGTLQRDISDEGSLDAPLPVIGVRGLWSLPHDFWIDASAQFFALEFDNVEGSLQDYRIAAMWQPKKWLGIGVGYNRLSIDVDVTQDRFRGALDWTYDGPMIFYSAAF